MKTTALRAGAVLGLTALTATLAVRAWGDQATAAEKANDKRSFTGTVATVDPEEHVLKVKGVLFSRSFNLGESCEYNLLDPGADTLKDLRPGQKVIVGYRNAAGVLVADRVEQQPLRFEGTVKEIDRENHFLTVHRPVAGKKFQIADECRVILREGKSGTLANVQPGEHVTVTYETPGRQATARQIEQTSVRFTGSLTAIDLTARTVKANSLTGSRKFNLASDCAIVVDGKLGGRMADLKPGERFTFSYDAVDGVNVVNRIAPAGSDTESLAAQTE